MRNQKGFTLIELMVVVGIVAALSAIAVPQYKIYQAKARQTQARVNLQSIYQVTTLAISNYSETVSCVNTLGWNTPTQGFYTFGTASGAAASATSAIITEMGACAATPIIYAPAGLTKANSGATGFSQTTGTSAGFVATTPGGWDFVAGGSIASTNTALDYWKIDGTATLSNTVPVLK